ncbi:unnamed protein product [Orchesella dallaii]|uniref:Uncharacterized protein n=1 Tax=Orchesella dallaii TaxID=48710 RepID=A0ABP1QGB2_9HEXA
MLYLLENPPVPTFVFIPFTRVGNLMNSELLATVNLLTNVCFLFFDYISMKQFILQFTSGKITKTGVSSGIEIKTPVSHKSVAKLFEITSIPEPHFIIHQWKRLNTNWDLDISSKSSNHKHAIERESGCDDMRQLFSQSEKDVISVQTCIKSIIFRRRNCSHPVIKTFLNFLLMFGPVLHANGQRPYYIHRFGYYFSGHRYAYFLEHENANEVNILSVFKPVPLFGWLILAFIAICLVILLKCLKVYENPPLVLFEIVLEQSAKLNSVSFIGCALVALWLLACILIRNVYTSTIYSILTAKALPDIPTTLEDALENYTHFDVVYNRRAYLDLIVKSKPIPSSKQVDDDLNVLWKRGRPLYNCNLQIQFRYNKFLESLAQSSEMLCLAHGSKLHAYATEIYQPRRAWSNFILIYNAEKNFDTLISIFGNRRRFEGIQKDFNVTMEGYLSSFQTIFSALVDDDLRELEQSGILQRLRFEYSSLRTLWMLRAEGKRLKNRVQRRVNFYTALHQSKLLMSEFGRKNNNDMNSVQLESVLVAWVLYGWMLIICFGVISLEVMWA